jgi:hypothetical protein
VDPEKQPLLLNGSETTLVSRQQLGKHVATTTEKHATIEVLLQTVFGMQGGGVIRRTNGTIKSVLYGSL